MSKRLSFLAALVAGLAVLAAGIVFTVVHTRPYESVASVVLSPQTNEPDRIASLLESFERSGTMGTYVELMSSDDTTAEARAQGVTITVQSIPATRAIRLIAEGDEDAVKPALRSVIANTLARQNTLRGLFTLRILEKPSEPVLAGPANSLLLIATLLLAVFAFVAVLVILRRVAPPPERPLQDRMKPARTPTKR
jgi:hypothetical protein